MKNKMKRYIGVFFLLLIVGGAITAKPCLAASAEVKILSDSSEVTIGESIFVSIEINSEAYLGDFEANLTYDDDILEYQGGASVVTGSSGFLKISDIGITQGSSTRKYTLKFEALQVGTCKISFQGRPRVYDYDAGLEMSVSSDILTLEVKAAETASSNASLKSFQTSPAQLTPAFDKNVFNYNVNVDNKTQKLIINALAEDAKATVSITGNELLEEGENKVIVTVIAESGDVIEYTINVFRELASEVETPSEEDVLTPGTHHGLFEVLQIDGENYAVYSGRYKLIEPDSEVKIPAGYRKDQMIISGISFNVYTLIEDEESEFRLIYAVNELGEEGFYQYDTIEKTLQRYVIDDASGYNNIDPTELEERMQSKQYRANLNKAAVVIALLSILSILLIFIMIRLILRLKGLKEDDLD